MKAEIEISPTPEQLAEIFVNWGSREQSNFINLIGKTFHSVDWHGELQCCYIVDEIDNNGRDFIYTLANFLKVKHIPDTSPKFNKLIDFYPNGESLNFK